MLAITASAYSGLYFLAKPHFKKIRVIISLINASYLTALYFTKYRPEPYQLNNYITGYFCYDLVIGHFADNNLHLLSGYIHHCIYIGLLTYIKYTDESHLIYLFLPFELPTALLDLKKLYPCTKINILFGTSFAISRILYNTYLITLMPNSHYSTVTALMLLLHIYWFNTWFNKYNNK